MKCPKCKTEVGNMEFCEVCGAATGSEPKSIIEGAAAREIKRSEEETAATGAAVLNPGINIKVPEFSIKGIIAIGLAVVLLIAAIVGFSKMKAYSTPDATAERYSNYIIEGQTDKAFQILDIKESSFINKDYFKKYIKSLNLKGKQLKEVRPVEQVNNAFSMFGQELTKDQVGNTQNLKFFEAQIDTDIYSLSLVQKGKSYVIFNTWKVVASDFTKKWSITAPKGSKVSVDGVQVEKVEKSDNSNNYSFENQNYKVESLNYVIDSIFPGDYEITASMPGAKDLKVKAAAGQQQSISFEPSAELMKELQQVAKNYLNLFYAKVDKSKYYGIVSPESSIIKNDSMGGGLGFFDSKAEKKLDSIEVSDKSAAIDDESHAKLEIIAHISVTSDEITDFFTGATKKVTNQRTSVFDMSFIKKDGKWLLLEPGNMGF